MSRLMFTLSLLCVLTTGGNLTAETATQAPVKASAPETAKVADQAYAELQNKAFATALPLYEKALIQAPGRAELWNEYAICLRNLHRYPAAVRAGWRAIQLDGHTTSQPWSAQANTFMETRAWKAAETCLERVEAMNKDRSFVAKAWLNLAFRKLAAREVAGAVADCRRALQLDATQALAWIDLGQALACTGGDPKEVAASFAKGLALAEEGKDAQQADYARQLAEKLGRGESIWPTAVAGRAWQVLPEALLTRPEADATRIVLPALVEHRYILEEGNTASTLSLTLPESWTEAFDRARIEHHFNVRFTVVGQEDFKVYFNPLKGLGNPLGVKATADEVVKRLLPGSSEKELVPQEITSPALIGYWVLSSDKLAEGKEPAKGQFRHLLTFILDAGRQQCVGTVLTNSKAPAVVDPCVAAFRSLRLIPAAAEN